MWYAAIAKLGLKAGQVVGQSVYDLYKDFPEMLEVMEKAFKGENIIYDVKIGDIYYRSWYSPYFDSDGEIIGLLGLAVDNTQQKLGI